MKKLKLRDKVFFSVGVFSLTSCGYHYAPVESGPDALTITVPYIQGDPSSVFNNALVYELSTSGLFRSVQSGGAFILKANLITDTHDRIGFRYDRDNTKGKLEKNLLGVESRRVVTAEVTLIEASSEKVILGPYEVSACVDYDYTDPGSPKDTIATTSSGKSESIIQFSLGQLDSYEGAYDDAAYLVFRKLAEKVVSGFVNAFPEEKKGI